MERVNPSKIFSVEGMVAVITGGGTGIGLMMTKALANNGAAKVYIVGRRKEKLEQAAKDASSHGNVIPIVGDVTSKESILEVAEQIRRDVGYVNLLVCNSGIHPPFVDAVPGEVSVQELAKKDAFSTNTTAIAFNTFAFLELLDAGNKKGNSPGRQSQVIVTSSAGAYIRWPRAFGVYPLTKSAGIHLTKMLSGLLAPYSIRVNAIAPGLFPSEMADGLLHRLGHYEKDDPTEDGAFPSSVTPAQRIGKLEDMAGTILYMASAAGAYLHGSVILIDGGRLGMFPSTF